MKNQQKAYLLASIVVLFWGTAAVAFKIGLAHFNYIQLLFWSSLVSVLILLTVLVAQRKLALLRQIKPKQVATLAVVGFLNPFLYYFVLFQAYEVLPAQVAQPVNYIWPIVLVLLSAVVLKQKVRGYDIIALLISLLGVAFISSQGEINIFSKSNPRGILLALASSIVWATFWILNMKFALKDEVVQLFVSFLFSTAYCLVAMIATDGFGHYPINGLLAALYVGAFEMGITFVLWLKALQLSSSTAKLSTLLYIVPFLALFFVRMVLHEQIVWTTLVGLVLIIGAIFFQKISTFRNKGIT